MSDVGLYASLEGELVAALTGLPDVVTVAPTLSVEDLVNRDGIRKPAIGIIDAGAKHRENYGLGQRLVGVVSAWELAIVVDNKRGAVNGRPALRAILEGIRDRLQNLQTSTSSRGRFRWQSDAYVNVAGGDLVAAVATFEINANFGT